MIGQKDWIIIGLGMIALILLITTIHYATRTTETFEKTEESGKSIVIVNPLSVNMQDNTSQRIPLDVDTIKIVRTPETKTKPDQPRPLYFTL